MVSFARLSTTDNDFDSAIFYLVNIAEVELNVMTHDIDLVCIDAWKVVSGGDIFAIYTKTFLAIDTLIGSHSRKLGECRHYHVGCFRVVITRGDDMSRGRADRIESVAGHKHLRCISRK